MSMCQASSETITAENTIGKTELFCCSPINSALASACQNLLSRTSFTFTSALHHNDF